MTSCFSHPPSHAMCAGRLALPPVASSRLLLLQTEETKMATVFLEPAALSNLFSMAHRPLHPDDPRSRNASRALSPSTRHAAHHDRANSRDLHRRAQQLPQQPSQLHLHLLPPRPHAAPTSAGDPTLTTKATATTRSVAIAHPPPNANGTSPMSYHSASPQQISIPFTLLPSHNHHHPQPSAGWVSASKSLARALIQTLLFPRLKRLTHPCLLRRRCPTRSGPLKKTSAFSS